MTIQKSKFKIKLWILVCNFAFWILNFAFCSFAQDNNRLDALTQRIIRAKGNEELNSAFQELKDLYFKDNKYTELVEILKSFSAQKKTVAPFINYYIAFTRYQQLKYLEEKQEWDEYFSQGNNYRDQIIDAAQKSIGSTGPKDPLHIYAKLLLWQFHKDQEDIFGEKAQEDLMSSVLEYAKDTQDAAPVRKVADKFFAYGEKGKSKELYNVYVNKLITALKTDEELREVALGFYKQGSLELSESVYDNYIEKITRSSPKEKIIAILADIARSFSYQDEGPKDPIYAERIFKKIEEIGGRDIFDQELMYLRAFNLEKVKDYIAAKDKYLQLIQKYPQSTHTDEATFKIGIIYTYILRDIKTGREYFERLAQKEAVSAQVISSIYQLGLLKQWEEKLQEAGGYYNKLIEKAQDNFKETVTLAKERLKEIDAGGMIEYNLKTFLDVSLRKEGQPFEVNNIYLTTYPYRIGIDKEKDKDKNAHISSGSSEFSTGCLEPEIKYLWSGHIGSAKPSLEDWEFNTTYTHRGTKEINLVIVLSHGIIGWNIDMTDVYEPASHIPSY